MKENIVLYICIGILIIGLILPYIIIWKDYKREIKKEKETQGLLNKYNRSKDEKFEVMKILRTMKNDWHPDQEL